jgi:hypothetical protein
MYGVPGTLRLDHDEQDVAAPAVGEYLLHVPETCSAFFDTLYQQHVVRPGNLGNELLPIWESGQLGNRRLPNCGGGCESLGVFVGELHHELDVSLGETLHFRQFVPLFAGQPGDDGGAPALLSLSLVDQATDVPVKLDQLGVRGEYRPRLCLLDAGLDFLKEIREACRNGQLRLVLEDFTGTGLGHSIFWADKDRFFSSARAEQS